MDELETTRRELETATRELATMRREQEIRRRTGPIISLLCLTIAGALVAYAGFAGGFWWGYLFAAATALLVVLTARLVLQWLIPRVPLSK